MGINARGLYAAATDAEDPAYVRGNWYPVSNVQLGAGAVIPASTIRLLPFRFRQMVSVAQLGARITTLAASGNIQLGIYAASQNTLLPTGPVLARTGNIATDTAVAVAAVPVGGITQFQRGVYWFGVMADSTAAAVVILQSAVAAVPESSALIGSATQTTISTGAATSNFHRIVSGITFGTWPDLTGVTTTEGTGVAACAGQFLVA